MKTKTAFIGLSHLGLVTSISWASVAPPVLGIDKDREIIKSLKNGKLIIKEGGTLLHEPGLDELFKKVKGKYYPTTNFSEIKNVDLVFFTLDTPKDSGSQKPLNDLIDSAIPHFKNEATIIIMSQVPIGFCRTTKGRIQKKRKDLIFHLYHWVDTIVMTNAVNRFLHPERIIIGSDNPSKPFTGVLKSGLKSFDCPVFHLSYESAELTKAAINLYLANSVTFANTLSDFCEANGSDINEIIPTLQTDKRIGPYAYLRPTLRIAGGHLERDLLMLERLARKKKISNGAVGFILKQNNKRYKWVLEKLKTHLAKKNPAICIWGLSYKKDTTSTKNAASLEILKALKGKAKIKVYDPMAIVPSQIKGYTRFNDKYEALKGADCLLILTDWDQFNEAQISKIKNLMKNHLIIDIVGIFEARRGELKNFTYIIMGVG